MQPEYTAHIINSDVVVAEPDKNKFSIEITPPASGLTDVIVRVSIPCGPKKHGDRTFLLNHQAARPKVTYQLPANSGSPVTVSWNDELDPVPDENYVAWELPFQDSIGAGTTMKIDVNGFGGNIPPGKSPNGAEVIVGIQDQGAATFTEKKLEVEVKLKAGDEKGVKIHYFDVSKDYVLHAGDEEVVLSWNTTAATSVVLFKNNVKVWPPYGGSKDQFFKDTPGITSLYRLEARPGMEDSAGETPAVRTQNLSKDQLVPRSLTVQVAQAGWNRQPLQQGYPTLLMAHNAFGVSDRLYGVFVNPSTKAVGLYSSATGFPLWTMESDFNKTESSSGGKTYRLSDMSHSPGVACGGRLWLIGGSSVDPEVISNEIWYYDRKGGTSDMAWVRANPGKFSARMGHCVVKFQEKLWVLGGLGGTQSRTEAMRDVWSYDPLAQVPQWESRGSANWPARCMFAAVATPASPGVPSFEKEKMWVYGGTTDPSASDAMRDLWSTTDGLNWNREKSFELGPLPGRPNGATLFWDGNLHLAGSFQAPTKDVLNALQGKVDDELNYTGGTLSAMVYSLCPGSLLWEANPVSWGWEQFGGDPFLMQSIVFNRFWFFWSLCRDIETAPKLNVFIPS